MSRRQDEPVAVKASPVSPGCEQGIHSIKLRQTSAIPIGITGMPGVSFFEPPLLQQPDGIGSERFNFCVIIFFHSHNF